MKNMFKNPTTLKWAALISSIALIILGAFKQVPISAFGQNISNALIICGIAIISIVFLAPGIIDYFSKKADK